MKIVAGVVLIYFGGIAVCLVLWLLAVMICVVDRLNAQTHKQRADRQRHLVRALGSVAFIPLWPYILVMSVVYGARWVKGSLAEDDSFVQLLAMLGIKRRKPKATTPQDKP